MATDHLRIYFFIWRSGTETEVMVLRDLSAAVRTWSDFQFDQDSCGVCHIGFDRPATSSIEATASQYLGRVLLTASAKYALPKGFDSFDTPVGQIEGIPVFLAQSGWGYTIEDELPTRKEASEWVKSFLDDHPERQDTLTALGILGESGYFLREQELPNELRRLLARYRYEAGLAGKWDENDPCYLAQLVPPWLLGMSVGRLNLSIRTTNALKRVGYHTILDIANTTVEKLFLVRNLGPKSVSALMIGLKSLLEEDSAWEPGALDVETLSGPGLLVPQTTATQTETAPMPPITSIAEGLHRFLDKRSSRELQVFQNRLGSASERLTLQESGEYFGVTRERVRQIEKRLVDRFVESCEWIHEVVPRLRQVLAGRSEPVPVVGISVLDPWFTGIERCWFALQDSLERIVESPPQLISIESLQYIGFMDEQAWQNVLRAGKTALQANVGVWTQEMAKVAVSSLLGPDQQDFQELLWNVSSADCLFVSQADGRNLLVAYGAGAESSVIAVLENSVEPLHFSQIHACAVSELNRDHDVRRIHNAAQEVAILLGRGSYGLRKHIPLTDQDLDSLVDWVEEIIQTAPSGRQWHASELVDEILEEGNELAGELDEYVLDFALRRSKSLKRLKRMVWAQKASLNGRIVARIDRRQAVISILRKAGSPLTSDEIQKRLGKYRGVGKYFQIFPDNDIIKLGRTLWGLYDRDVRLDLDQKVRMLDGLYSTLLKLDQGIHISETHLLPLGDRCERDAYVLFSLASQDARFSIGKGGRYVYLRCWEGPRRVMLRDAVQLVLENATMPQDRDGIQIEVESLTQMLADRSIVSSILSARGEYDPNSKTWILPTQPDE